MRKKISGVFGFMLIALLLVVVQGGVVKATDVEGEECHHNYGDPVYEWEEDGSAAKVILTCQNDNSHTKEYPMTITSEVAEEATCTKKGKTTYTGKVTSDEGTEYENSKTIEDIAINQNNHVYGEATYDWKEDGSAARVVLTCQNDNGHTKEYPMTITSEVAEEATCTKKGKTTYTGKVTSDEGTEYENSKTIEDIAINQNNHVYGEATYDWKEDGSAARVVLTCQNDNSHTKEYPMTITSEVAEEATCTKKGKTTYTGKVTSDEGTEYENSKTIENIDIDKNNHTYGKEVYEWEDDESAAKVVWTCQNDNNHIKEYPLTLTATEVKKATCVSKGKIHYTAIAEIGGQFYKDEKIIISSIDPQNHIGKTKIANEKSATCTAAGYTGDEICLSCNNAKNRGLTIDAKGYKWDAGKVTTQSTDNAEGQFTYTCTNGCKHTKTEIIPRKSVSIELGKKAKIISNVSVCQKMTFAKASKYKKYLTFNTKTGEIKTKKYYKVKISKSIPVKVFVGGKEYTVNIKIKIPAPKVKVTRKAVKNSFGKYQRYTFKYNVKGANRIKVRVENANKTGKSKTINKIFDRYVKKSKSNKSSYIEFTDKTMKKLKKKNGKVTFKIIAYYGKNQSETLTITK